MFENRIAQPPKSGMLETRLTITGDALPDVYIRKNGMKGTRKRVVCVCVCGTSAIYRKSDVVSGKVRSCGCWREENRARLSMYNRGACGKWAKGTAGVEPLQTELWRDEDERE